MYIYMRHFIFWTFLDAKQLIFLALHAFSLSERNFILQKKKFNNWICKAVILHWKPVIAGCHSFILLILDYERLL